MRKLIGAKLGDYEVLGEIGRGAMGIVYKARQYSLDRPVALKVLSPLLATDESFIERFKREATIAATLDHSSIVRVYEAGTHLDLDSGERLHYFAMQYIEGETVHDRLQREGRLAFDEAVAIAVHVAQGLEYAWRKARIIHRDIKPSNIFLAADGQVKLGDLGLACAAGDSEGGAGLTATGGIVGTAHFMSPEQARGERGLDFRSDIYGLGCMLYRMLCGKHLYEGPFASVVAQHLTEPPPSVRMLSPDCPVELASLIEKMLAKHPSGRQQSYEELITELRLVHEQLTSGAAEGGSRSPSAISSVVLPSSAPSRKLLPTILYTIMGTTAVILLAGALIWVPWKQTEQQPLNSEAAKARSAPVAQTLLSAAAVSPKEEPKPASDTPADVGRVPSPGATATTTPPGQGTGPTTAAPATEPPLAKPEATPAETNTNSLVPVQLAQAAPPPAPAQPHAAQPLIQNLADDAFIKTVSALPVEQQVGAVVTKLKELNPNFDGKETHKVEGGVVTELAFSSVGVTDISPLKALTWLKKLTVTPWTATQKGSLSDLSVLKGMKLTWLYCHNNPITDLSPLQGMPLTVLSCGGTQASNLAPLTGMKLTVLSCNDTTVGDLASLEGMPLTVLWCNNTQVTDLSPLKAMPLREIKCDFVAERDAALLRGIRPLAKINDQPAGAFWMRAGPVAAAIVGRPPSVGAGAAPPTSPSKGLGITPSISAPAERISAKEQIRRFITKMKELNPAFDGELKHVIEKGKVVELCFSTEHVTDLSPIRLFQGLETLSLARNDRERSSLPSLSALEGMQLKSLDCRGAQIMALSPLVNMPLTKLDCHANRGISDLSPLAGMKLTWLNCNNTPISDLSPLKGMRLTFLECHGTGVSDLSPLQGMPLNSLFIMRTKVQDLSPIKGIHLRELSCDFVPERDTQILRSIKTLEKINGVSAKEFWKRVAAGDVPETK